MGDEQSMNAIPTGVWVRRELVDALREALNEYPDATLYPTPEAFNVALMDTFKRAAQAARAVVDAVETEDEPKVPMTDLPDAETAWAEWDSNDATWYEHPQDYARFAFLAGFAAASDPWAEQLDAAKRDGQIEVARAFQAWAATNEIAENIDWKWFGEICRRYSDIYETGDDSE